MQEKRGQILVAAKTLFSFTIGVLFAVKRSEIINYNSFCFCFCQLPKIYGQDGGE